jgi:hypothetical protein
MKSQRGGVFHTVAVVALENDLQDVRTREAFVDPFDREVIGRIRPQQRGSRMSVPYFAVLRDDARDDCRNHKKSDRGSGSLLIRRKERDEGEYPVE